MRLNEYDDEHDAAEGTPLLLQSISVSKLPLHFHQKHATMKRPSHSCRSAAGLTASLILFVAMLLMVVPFLTQHGNSMSASAVMEIVQPGIYHLEPIETKETTNHTNNNQPQVTENVTVEEVEITPVVNASAAADIQNDQAENDRGNEGQVQQNKDTVVPKTSLKFPVPLSPLVRPNNLPPTFMNETVDVTEDQHGAEEHVAVIATPTVTHAPTTAPSTFVVSVPTLDQDESENVGEEEQDEVTDDEEEETFAELAVRLLPLYYQRMLATLDALTPTVQPGQVYVSRKAILKVRDLMDVFAPIYPNRKMELHDNDAVEQTQRQQTSSDHAAIHEEQENARYDHRRHHHHHHHNARRHDGESKHPHHHHDHHRVLSSKHKHEKDKHHHHHSDSSKTDSRHADKTDPWWELRRLLDDGYETIGTFLDLDHSRVKYTTKMETKHRDKVLDWLEEFRKYAFTHDVLSMFQPPPSHFGTYEHYKESHLFWGSAKETKRPSPDEPAATVLRRLLKHQAKAAAKYLDVSLGFHTVMEKKRHEEYHNLRKVLRSMVDEFEIMGDVIDPYGILSEEVSVLKRARSSLGDLNDDYTAFSIYDGGEGHRRRKHGREDNIHDKWLDFKNSAVQKGGLKDTLKSLEEKLDEANEMLTLSLTDFLRSVKRRPTHHLVIGNGAGDADSIVSAVTLAYIESLGKNSVVKTPIVSVSRRALERQRPEVKLLFQLAEVSVDSLICTDDYLMQQRDMTDYDVALVDHNAIESTFQDRGWTVRGIVDHHKDQGLYRSTCSGSNRTIAFAHGKPTAVSTCVLVFERMQKLAKEPYPSSVGLLLLGVILLDSLNLSTDTRQVSRRDKDAVSNLQKSVDWESLPESTKRRLDMLNSTQPDLTTLFRVLQSARYDPEFWDALSVNEALDYDFKEYSYGSGSFGVSTILMSLHRFLTKPYLEENILAFMAAVNTDFLAIMLANESGTGSEQRRQLMLCGTNYFPMHDLVNFLTSDQYKGEPLQLKEIPHARYSSILTMRFFDQGNVLSSRKQIGPILVQFFEEFWQT